tara:strand:- start:272 stop:2227 length:1956 start_codon:yes stop_codon:yes gene_type:complete
MTKPVNTKNSQFSGYSTIPIEKINIFDGIWKKMQVKNRDISIKAGYKKLEETGCIENLLIAAGKIKKQYNMTFDCPFMDSDLYKWLEAVAYDLAINPDDELMKKADDIINKIEMAQCEDGYLHTYSQTPDYHPDFPHRLVEKPVERWKSLRMGHELYCAGHLFQAAVAYYQSTGKRKILDVAERFAVLINDEFVIKGRRPATPGHAVIEMGLIELYRETKNEMYKDLSKFFIDQRGKKVYDDHPQFDSSYYQDRVKVREASVIEGHAVRAGYFASGITDLYIETGEEALLTALNRQWENMVSRRMYVTGAIGARHYGESFGLDYALPNESAYCETCAAIASIQWNWRMFLATGNGKHNEIIEKTMYNGFLSGISLDGKNYFYKNPLSSDGVSKWGSNDEVGRVEWFGCACCPPNVMRTLSSIGHYLFSESSNGIQVHQYGSISINTKIDGEDLSLRMDSNYPWSGNIKLFIHKIPVDVFNVGLRIPEWTNDYKIMVNNEKYNPKISPNGYAEINRQWKPGDNIDLQFEIKPYLIVGNPRVESITGKVAIGNGPLIYCIEASDQSFKTDLTDIMIDPDTDFEVTWSENTLEGVNIIMVDGKRMNDTDWENSLYKKLTEKKSLITKDIKIKAIPYFTWANREISPMKVWIPRS